MSHDVNAHIEDAAVQFSMHGPERPLAVRISSRALQRYFGAGPERDTWLPAYVANFRVIHAVAQLKAGQPAASLVLDLDDFTEESIRQLRAANAG